MYEYDTASKYDLSAKNLISSAKSLSKCIKAVKVVYGWNNCIL